MIIEVLGDKETEEKHHSEASLLFSQNLILHFEAQVKFRDTFMLKNINLTTLFIFIILL